MFYTGKGDNGTTKIFGCNQKISKSSAITEALGAMDEVNSFLGLCKIKSAEERLFFGDKKISEIVLDIQQTMFIIQAELAGAKMSVKASKIKNLENLIDKIEKTLPPIKTFLIPGGTELGAMFDYARTVARRAERRVVKVSEEGEIKVGKHTLAYLNRLSSILYAMARLSSHLSGINEESPEYE